MLTRRASGQLCALCFSFTAGRAEKAGSVALRWWDGYALMSDNFLNSKAWKEKRRRILARDGYQCQYSKRYGKNVPGNIVHHIFPRADFPEYRLASWNLITVCAAAHKQLENEYGLTEEGVELLRRTARKNDIPIPAQYATEKEIEAQGKAIRSERVILVMGLPGAGKTTYVRKHLGDGIVYDLDYIAAALRLTDPKAENHQAAVAVANALLEWYCINAPSISQTVFIIRTAPTIDELQRINPSRVVICSRGNYQPFRAALLQRIADAEKYLRQHSVPVESCCGDETTCAPPRTSPRNYKT